MKGVTLKLCGNPEHNELLDESEFGKLSKSPDGLQLICKECKRNRDKMYYRKGGSTRRTQLNSYRDKYKGDARRFVYDYLSAHPCSNCGETNVIVLEFNHRNPKNKKYNIADMVTSGMAIETIKKEIKKCNVLCANCHRMHSAKQFNYYTYAYS